MAAGSAFAPPQPEPGGTGSGRRPEPSLCMTQSELCTSGFACHEKAISFPCGDQLNVQQWTETVGGRIRFRPVPFRFITNTPSGSPLGLTRSKTIRFPLGDQLPGTASPPGFEVICVDPPPSEELIVWIPFRLPSSLNVSQRSSVPSGDGFPQGLKSPGIWPSTSRKVPSSGVMIREPPPGKSQQVAMWAPSENQIGTSPTAVGPCTSRWPEPSGLTT